MESTTGASDETTMFSEQPLIGRLIALSVVIIALAETRCLIGFGQPLLALVGLCSLLCLNNGDAQSLGLRLSPVRGWKFWCQITVLFAILICIAVAFCALLWLIMAWEFPRPITTAPSLSVFISMCIHAPFSEEVIFRVLLTAALLPTLGERRTIVAGGVVFALLHILYGNPGPDNQVAGFLLGWAFIRSKTILVPLAMHSAGNLVALGLQVIAWYLY